MDDLRHQFNQSQPLLVGLVTNCLQNHPHLRYSADGLLEQLIPLKEETGIKNVGNYCDYIIATTATIQENQTEELKVL